MNTLDETAFGSIRPRLRNDVVFLRVETGIYLRSAENSCVLKGAGAYEWMSVLGPRMNGEHTVDELCDGLDEERRKTAVGLVGTLISRGFARHAPPSRPDVLPAGVGTAFAAQTHFVEHFMHGDDSSPQELFARFRASRVLVTGPPGAVSAAAIRGLLRNGLSEVTVDDPAWKGEFDAELAQLEAADAPASLVTVADAAREPSRFHVVLCTAGLTDTAPLRALTERLLRAPAGAPPGADTDGTRLLPVLTGAGRAVIGPFSGAAYQPCWLCAQIRLAAGTGPAQAAELWRGLADPEPETGGGVGPIAAEMLGNAAAFDVFRLRTGQLAPDDERHAVVQDLLTLESRRDRVLPHPRCPLAHTQAPAPVLDAEAPPQDDNDAYGRASVLVHPQLGLVSQWTDDEIRQIPLKTGRARLAPAARMTDPVREISAYDTETVLAARTRALQAAVGAYVGRLGSRRRPGTPTADEARHVPAHALEVRSGATPEGLHRAEHRLPAVSLHDGGAWEVPAAAVHPLSPDNDDRAYEPTAAGAAVGWTGAEIRERGLCSALAHRGLLRALRGTDGAMEFPDELLAGDEDVAFALRSLRHIDGTARVFALPGAAPCHAVVAVAEGPPGALPDWAPGYGPDAREALRTAVRDAVGQAVARHTGTGEPDPGDRLLTDFDPRTLSPDGEVTALPAGPGPAMDEMLSALAAAGTRALFTETTPVDLASVRGLVTGTVLLADTGAHPDTHTGADT